MNLEEDGTVALSSWMGSLCSLLFLMVVTMYTIHKSEIMLYRRDHNVIESMTDSSFDTSYVFDFD